MYLIGWQISSLPHVHILLWLEDKVSPSRISAEFLVTKKNLALHNKKNMIYGPCGLHGSRKMLKAVPTAFVRKTQTGDDVYPT